MAANIATFSPPMKGVSTRDSLPRFFVAVIMDDVQLDVPLLMAVDMNGVMELMGINEAVIDWRYDPKTQLWSDPTEQPDPVDTFGDGPDA